MSDVCRFAVKEVIRRINTKTMRLRVRGQRWTHRKWNISGIQLCVFYKKNLNNYRFCLVCFIHEIIKLSKVSLGWVFYCVPHFCCCCVSCFCHGTHLTTPWRFVCNCLFCFNIFACILFIFVLPLLYMLANYCQAKCMHYNLSLLYTI